MHYYLLNFRLHTLYKRPLTLALLSYILDKGADRKSGTPVPSLPTHSEEKWGRKGVLYFSFLLFWLM